MPHVCTLRQRIVCAVRATRPVPAVVAACDIVLESKVFVSATMLRALTNL